jgi:hypothetical protein
MQRDDLGLYFKSVDCEVQADEQWLTCATTWDCISGRSQVNEGKRAAAQPRSDLGLYFRSIANEMWTGEQQLNRATTWDCASGRSQ